ncbi:hypothetical protein PMAYCL1PPCAC_10257, partial [Pristionchus mayeri]
CRTPSESEEFVEIKKRRDDLEHHLVQQMQQVFPEGQLQQMLARMPEAIHMVLAAQPYADQQEQQQVQQQQQQHQHQHQQQQKVQHQRLDAQVVASTQQSAKAASSHPALLAHVQLALLAHVQPARTAKYCSRLASEQ